MVEITPEIQAQLDEQKKQCIFCKLIAGEMEAKKVYEDKFMVGILDINPAVKGHMLFLPKEHYPILPYLPPETFKHMFGTMAKLVGAGKKAMLTTGANVFVANGGIAGQQAPHFLVHLFPREKGDKFDKYAFDSKKELDEEKAKQVNNMLAQNIPILMRNHLTRNPAKWHTGKINTADYLSELKENVVYEDEKALCVVPQNPQCIGHLVIYSQDEEKDFENLDTESASHLFFVASFCTTAVFEGIGAHGSNIILKTGTSKDNPDGQLCLHVFPRFQDDGMDVLWKPLEPRPNLDEIQGKLKDKMFMIEYEMKPKKKTEVIDLDAEEVVISEKPKETEKSKEKKKEEIEEISEEDEITRAINELKKG